MKFYICVLLYSVYTVISETISFCHFQIYWSSVKGPNHNTQQMLILLSFLGLFLYKQGSLPVTRLTAGLPQSLTVSGSDIQTDYAGCRTHTTYHLIKAYLVCITAASLLFGIYLYYIEKWLLLHIYQWPGQNELTNLLQIGNFWKLCQKTY